MMYPGVDGFGFQEPTSSQNAQPGFRLDSTTPSGVRSVFANWLAAALISAELFVGSATGHGQGVNVAEFFGVCS